MTITVGELRAATNGLPDDAPLIGEAFLGGAFGTKFDVETAFTIGTKTDNPGLVLRLRQIEP